jgi:hypothetical protein
MADIDKEKTNFETDDQVKSASNIYEVCFSASNECTILMQVIALNDSFMVWVGQMPENGKPAIGEISVGMQNRIRPREAISSTLYNGTMEGLSESLAKKLGKLYLM